MPLIVRLSNWKMVDFAAQLADTPQELEELLAPAVEEGVDLFDCSQRRFWEPCFANGVDGQADDLNLAGWVRKVTGVPTCTIGSVGLDSDFFTNLAEGKQSGINLASLEELMRRFDRGDFDLVAVGRAMIAEPDWPKLVRAGTLDQLKPFTPKALADALMEHVEEPQP